MHTHTFSSRQKLLRFDVVSLFTIALLKERVKLIADELFSEKKPNQPWMKKEILIKLLGYLHKRTISI